MEVAYTEISPPICRIHMPGSLCRSFWCCVNGILNGEMHTAFVRNRYFWCSAMLNLLWASLRECWSGPGLPWCHFCHHWGTDPMMVWEGGVLSCPIHYGVDVPPPSLSWKFIFPCASFSTVLWFSSRLRGGGRIDQFCIGLPLRPTDWQAIHQPGTVGHADGGFGGNFPEQSVQGSNSGTCHCHGHIRLYSIQVEGKVPDILVSYILSIYLPVLIFCPYWLL